MMIYLLLGGSYMTFLLIKTKVSHLNFFIMNTDLFPANNSTFLPSLITNLILSGLPNISIIGFGIELE